MAVTELPDVEVQRWLGVLRRHWMIFGAVLVGVLLLTLAAALLPAPHYRASATVVLDPNLGTPLQSSTTAPPVLSPAESTLARSALVSRRAEAKLGYTAPIQVTSDDQGLTLVFSSSEPTAERATAVANAYATSYADERNRRASAAYQAAAAALESAIAQLSSAAANFTDKATEATLAQQRDAYNQAMSDVQVRGVLAGVSVARLAVPADVPDHATRPSLTSYLVIGLVAALALAVAAVGLADVSTSGAVNSRALRAVTSGLPVLAIVRRRSLTDRVRVMLSRSRGTESLRDTEWETFRSLGTALDHLTPEGAHVINVTSARRDDGAAAVAIRLAAAYGLRGRPTVLAGLDRRADATLDPLVRKADVISEGRQTSDEPVRVSIRRFRGIDALTVLVSDAVEDASGGGEVDPFLDELDTLDQMVVGLSGPVLTDGDALAVAARVDLTVLVVRAGRTRDADLMRAMELFGLVDAEIAGLVVVDADQSFQVSPSTTTRMRPLERPGHDRLPRGTAVEHKSPQRYAR